MLEPSALNRAPRKEKEGKAPETKRSTSLTKGELLGTQNVQLKGVKKEPRPLLLPGSPKPLAHTRKTKRKGKCPKKVPTSPSRIKAEIRAD